MSIFFEPAKQAFFEDGENLSCSEVDMESLHQQQLCMFQHTLELWKKYKVISPWDANRLGKLLTSEVLPDSVKLEIPTLLGKRSITILSQEDIYEVLQFRNSVRVFHNFIEYATSRYPKCRKSDPTHIDYKGYSDDLQRTLRQIFSVLGIQKEVFMICQEENEALVVGREYAMTHAVVELFDCLFDYFLPEKLGCSIGKYDISRMPRADAIKIYFLLEDALDSLYSDPSICAHTLEEFQSRTQCAPYTRLNHISEATMDALEYIERNYSEELDLTWQEKQDLIDYMEIDYCSNFRPKFIHHTIELLRSRGMLSPLSGGENDPIILNDPLCKN